jgi:hypothetical protein
MEVEGGRGRQRETERDRKEGSGTQPYATSDTCRTTDSAPESANCRASFASAAANTLASYAGALLIRRSYLVTLLRCTPGRNIREKVNI